MRTPAGLACTAVVLGSLVPRAGAQTFRAIAEPPGHGNASPYDMSADGSVILVQVLDYNSPTVPFGYLWTQTGGWQAMPFPCWVQAISADGSTVIGQENASGSLGR